MRFLERTRTLGLWLKHSFNSLYEILSSLSLETRSGLISLSILFMRFNKDTSYSVTVSCSFNSLYEIQLVDTVGSVLSMLAFNSLYEILSIPITYSATSIPLSILFMRFNKNTRRNIRKICYRLSILFMRFTRTCLHFSRLKVCLSILFMRFKWVGLWLYPTIWCLSILFMRFSLSFNSFKSTLSSFNSLYEILRKSVQVKHRLPTKLSILFMRFNTNLQIQ